MLFILLSSTFPWLPLLPLPPYLSHLPQSPPLCCSLLCCKIQLPNWFNFLPFRTLLTYFPCHHSASLSLPLSISLTLLPASLSLSSVSHADLAEPQIIEWFEFLYWICCLTRRSFLIPRSPFPFCLCHTHIFVLCPRGFSYFSLLFFPTYNFSLLFLPAVSFVPIFFSIKMEIVGELENCLSIGPRLPYASRIKRSCKLNM